jgi:hypothetical protein
LYKRRSILRGCSFFFIRAFFRDTFPSLCMLAALDVDLCGRMQDGASATAQGHHKAGVIVNTDHGARAALSVAQDADALAMQE